VPASAPNLDQRSPPRPSPNWSLHRSFRHRCCLRLRRVPGGLDVADKERKETEANIRLPITRARIVSNLPTLRLRCRPLPSRGRRRSGGKPARECHDVRVHDGVSSIWTSTDLDENPGIDLTGLNFGNVRASVNEYCRNLDCEFRRDLVIGPDGHVSPSVIFELRLQGACGETDPTFQRSTLSSESNGNCEAVFSSRKASSKSASTWAARAWAGSRVVVGASVVGGVVLVVGSESVVVAVGVGVAVVTVAPSPSVLEQAAASDTAHATTSTLPLRAIDGWYFVPTTSTVGHASTEWESDTPATKCQFPARNPRRSVAPP
jgi:hypothetical protein